MIRLASPESDPGDAPCLACRAKRRWQDHLVEHGTPPDAAEFMNLWPHADVHTMRTILGVLAVCEGRKRTRRIGSLCECSDAMREARETYETDLHDQFEHEGAEPVDQREQHDSVMQEPAKHSPAPSVPRPSRRRRRTASACIGLAVVVGGVIGWHEFFHQKVSNVFLLADSAEYARILDEWEADSLDAIEQSTIAENGESVVSFDLLDENTDGLLSIAGLDGPDSVDAELVKQLIQRHFRTVHGLLGKTEEEVNAGVDALLDLQTEPAWMWLKHVVRPVRQLLLNAAQYPADRDN